jgi:hypothetical protein
MESSDVGSMIGVGVLALFGLLIAFVVPMFIRSGSRKDEDPAGNRQIILWLRILGLAVTFIGLLQIVLLFILERYHFR